MATEIDDLPTLESLRAEQRALSAQLSRLRRRLRDQLALEFAVDATIVLTATAGLLVFLDWWFRFGLPVRLFLLLSSLSGAFGFLGVRALRYVRAARLDELSLALTLDRYRPGLGQRIADVLQLPDLLNEPSRSSSPAMVRLAVRQACEALAGSDWRSLWNRRRTLGRTGILLLGLLAPLSFSLAAPRAARLSVARWLLGSSERWPQRIYLTVLGLDNRGQLLAPRDERFTLEVRADLPLVEPQRGGWFLQGRGEPFFLRRKPNPVRTPQTVLVRERTGRGLSRVGPMVATGPAQFRFEFPPSSTSSTFELEGGDDWLGPIRVERVDRPSLSNVRLKVKEPGASYEGFRLVADPRQHLLFLPDTEVELTLAGNEVITKTRLNVHPGIPPTLQRLDDRTFAARWVLREATTLEVLLTSGKTGLASQPTFLSIGLLRDREPRVTLRALGVSGHVTPIATIPLTLAATDDLGLAALRLQADRTWNAGEKSEPRTERKTVSLLPPQEKDRPLLDHQVRHDVLLQADAPRVGTLLRFVGEADDRCARGPQTGRSGALQLQVVSADELFYEILIRQRAERSKFLATLETTEKQTPLLAGKPSRDDLQNLLRGIQTGTRQLDQIAGRIAETLQEMKLNQIGSPKSHRLLQEGVIDPTRALTAGPLNQLRGLLQSMTGGGSASADRTSARGLHGEVVSKMKAILDQMSQWESFVDVVNQVAEVIRMQKKVLQATEKARATRTQEIFDDRPE
ncbi:MAG: hypothetical protein NVSMB9_23730 [Isosphaeraceae bacterium]